MASDSLSETLRETLAAFEEGDPGTPLSTVEVAERLDLGRRSTYERLTRLVDHDRIETKKIGARGRVWWRPLTSAAAAAGATDRDSGRLVEYERQLRETREFVQHVLDTVPASVFVVDSSGDVVTANDRLWRQFGLDDSCQDLAIGDLEIYDEDGQAVPPDERPYRSAFDTAEPVSDWRCQIELPSGERRWVSLDVSPITGTGGSVERVLVAAQDVSQLRAQARRLERQRDELEEELGAVFERIDDGFFALDENLRFTNANDRATDLLAPSSGELIGEHVWETLDPGSPAQAAFEEALATQEAVSFEQYDEPLDAWFETHVYPSDSGISVYFRDVSRRKERERELERYETIVETVHDGVYTVDADGRFSIVNESYADMTGYSRAELVGAHVSKVVDDDTIERVRGFERRMVDGEIEAATFEADVHTAEGGTIRAEGAFSLLPGAPGEMERVGVVRDVSERTERERELERYETMLATVSDGIYALDESSRFVAVNDAFCEMVGWERAELVGAHATRVTDEENVTTGERLVAELAAEGGSVATVEEAVTTKAGESIPVENRVTNYELGDDQRGRIGTVRDITHRKERERRLEASERRYRALAENFPNGAVTLVDDDLRYVIVGGTPIEEADKPVSDLEGELLEEALPPELSDLLVPLYVDALDGERRTVEASIGERVHQFRLAPVRDDDGAVVAAIGMSQDVTERNRRERDLERYTGLIDAIGEPVYELDERGRFTFVNEPLVEKSGYTESELLGEHVSLGMDDEAIAHVESEIGDLADGDFAEPITTEYDVVSKDGERFPVENRISLLTDDDGRFRGSAGMLWDVSERNARERELLHHRERLAALNNINELVRDITDAVIDQSTREEIESIVCDRLAASDSYQFAWIGAFDLKTETVIPRTAAGIERTSDEIPVHEAHRADRTESPIAEAILAQELQVTRGGDPVSAPPSGWVDDPDHEVDSFAAVPIVHDETTYGVLNVYTGRANAFTEEERAVFDQLGEVVGHAIGAVDRKRALTSDEVVELEFEIPDVFEAIDLPVSTDGTIRLDRAVPIGDGRFLEYGTATRGAMDAVDAVVASNAFPQWDAVTILAEDADEVSFELVLTDPPVLSTVSSHGGYVQEAKIADGDYFMRIHLAPTTDVRTVVETIEESYPAITLVTQQQVTRDRPTGPELRNDAFDALTERQRAVLEVAFTAGFFEWPRERNGEAIAETLDVSPSTFHQHLRHAERKLLTDLFAVDAPADLGVDPRFGGGLER